MADLEALDGEPEEFGVVQDGSCANAVAGQGAASEVVHNDQQADQRGILVQH